VTPENRDFNFTQFSGKDFRAEEVIEQAQTFPVFAATRLVLIKHLHEASANQLDVLLSYIEEPVPETVLLLTAAKIDARRKFYQLLKKKGAVLEFKKIYDNQLPAFVRDLAGSYGLDLTAGALKLFCKRVGADLTEVQGELEKLKSYLGESDIAQESDVASIVSDTRIESVFDLTDSLGRGDCATALTLLHRLLDEGQAPLMILAMVTRHYRQIWKLSELLAQNVPQKDLPRKVGVSPYFLKGLTQQAKRYSRDEYRTVFKRLLVTDLALKSSGAGPDAQMESLVLELCAMGRGDKARR